MNNSSTLNSTVLATVQQLENNSANQHANHLFATTSEATSSFLNDVIHGSNQLLTSLAVFASSPPTNPRLISLLRQQSGLSHSLHLSDQSVRQTIAALRQRKDVRYGEDIPVDRVVLVEWCISRFEAWGTAAGMEVFRDDSREGDNLTLVLGGKVLVVDVDFSIDKADRLRHVLSISGVKTTYAIPNGDSPVTDGSSVLNNFLTVNMRNFCEEVQKDEDLLNPLEAARLGSLVFDHLKYLVVLDRLAERKDDGGIRWFVDLDKLYSTLTDFAKQEAAVVASSLNTLTAPLDVAILRSHAYPLPYFALPSISFLTYLSPLAYLTLLRSLPDGVTSGGGFDIPDAHIREYLAHSREGATLATLRLVNSTNAPLFPSAMSMPTLTSRPTFPLVPGGSEIEHSFPQTTDPSITLDFNDADGHHFWILDFTDGGRHRGVVMSQSRMRDVELVVNPLSSIAPVEVGMMSFGSGSWVDLLLNSTSSVSPERYTALYRSPTSAHPILQLHLTAPNEPGYILERVPVNSMKEVWGILEVVREQCWLNEVLKTCNWTAEGLKTADTDELPPEMEATEEELALILGGMHTPRRIPVNVYLPSQDPLFDATGLDAIGMPSQPRRHRIVMTSPERAPMTGLVEISVSYDEARPRGVSVQVSGAISADLQPEVLEEICRRGGTLGLSGRVWTKARNAA